MYFKIIHRESGYRAYIMANNGKTLFWTEAYTTRANAEKAIQIVQRGAGGAPVK